MEGLTLFDTIVLSTEICFYSFHLSLFILLVLQRNSRFNGCVYDLFRAIFVADFMFIFTKYLTKVPSFGLWPEFFKANGYLANLNLIASGYFVFLQFLAHTLIAFNRFTLFWFPSYYAKIWKRQWYTALILICPILILAHRFPQPGIFLYTPKGDVVVRMKNDDDVQTIYIVASVFYFSCTAIQAIFNVLATLKWQSYKKTSAAKENDMRLLYISFIFFLLQLFRSVYNYIRPFFTTSPDMAYLLQLLVPIIADVYAWSGSVSLILLSKSTRRAYLNFYARLLGIESWLPESTLSNVPKITTTAVQKITSHP